MVSLQCTQQSEKHIRSRRPRKVHHAICVHVFLRLSLLANVSMFNLPCHKSSGTVLEKFGVNCKQLQEMQGQKLSIWNPYDHIHIYLCIYLPFQFVLYALPLQVFSTHTLTFLHTIATVMIPVNHEHINNNRVSKEQTTKSLV